jgi:hypothetical protein
MAHRLYASDHDANAIFVIDPQSNANAMSTPQMINIHSKAEPAVIMRAGNG